MDLIKLSEVVTKEARVEADAFISAAQKQADELAFNEKRLIESKTNERLEEEKNHFASRINYLRFNFESDFKKKVLHLKHHIMEDLKSKLYQTALENIRSRPMDFLTLMLKKSPVTEAGIYVSAELGKALDSQLLDQYNTLNNSAFVWRGVDPSMELGLSLEKGQVRYIFPLREIIHQFIDQHAVDINEKFYT
jgi:hypothetical protein